MGDGNDLSSILIGRAQAGTLIQLVLEHSLSSPSSALLASPSPSLSVSFCAIQSVRLGSQSLIKYVEQYVRWKLPKSRRGRWEMRRILAGIILSTLVDTSILKAWLICETRHVLIDHELTLIQLAIEPL